MDAPFRAGDLLHGYQAVADNLPNDPRIHEKKGIKKIFFKNFMDARVNYVILPLAQSTDAAGRRPRRLRAKAIWRRQLMHEISHGLGPAFARMNGKQVTIREAIGPAYSRLEEAKADVVGMFGLKWLMDHGALPKKRAAGILRVVCGRNFPHRALRHWRGARARGDDGVQLSGWSRRR